VRAAATLALVVLAFGTFWQARTYLATGNPAFPDSMGSAIDGAVAEHGDSLRDTVLRYATLPWEITFDGRSAFESPLPNPAAILLAGLAPLGLLALRRPLNRAQAVCGFFVLAYLVYWAAILNTLRYAILPIAILAMICGAHAVTFFDQQAGGALGRAVRISLGAALTYCLLFSALGTMIIEVNVPQLKYFAGRLDKAAYLREATTTYGAMEYLLANAGPDDPIYGAGYCCHGYAPNPDRFACTLCPPEGCSVEKVSAKIAQTGARFLVAASSDRGKKLAAAVGAGEPPKQVYRARNFTVYRLAAPARGRSRD